MSPAEISTEQLKEYLYYCKEKRGRSSSTINQIISAVKILKQDVLGQPWNEKIKIKRPRKERPLADILSKQEVIKLIECTSNPKHKAILAVLYSSGIHREELQNLPLTDIDPQRMVIRVSCGKGNKSRDTLLAAKTLKLLRDYYARVYPKTEIFVFESWTPGQQYSATSVANIVRRSAKKAGINKRVYPHSLRHAFATHMQEAGGTPLWS